MAAQCVKSRQGLQNGQRAPCHPQYRPLWIRKRRKPVFLQFLAVRIQLKKLKKPAVSKGSGIRRKDLRGLVAQKRHLHQNRSVLFKSDLENGVAENREVNKSSLHADEVWEPDPDHPVRWGISDVDREQPSGADDLLQYGPDLHILAELRVLPLRRPQVQGPQFLSRRASHSAKAQQELKELLDSSQDRHLDPVRLSQREVQLLTL